MINRSYLSSILKPALILYLSRLVLAALIAFPVFVFLNSKFALSEIAGKLWPLPSGYVINELLWHFREMLLIIVPLLLLVIILSFVINQFLYGGVYELICFNKPFVSGDFFAACGKHFVGFIKIALVGIIGFVVVALASDLMGVFIGKLFGLIYEPLGSIVNGLVVFISLYIYLAFLAVVRLTQVQYGISSIISAYTKVKDVIIGKAKYFIVSNSLVGFLAIVTITISFMPLILVYHLPFSPPIIILVVLFQQIIVFWICLIEVVQIISNKRFVKESNNGTQMG